MHLDHEPDSLYVLGKVLVEIGKGIHLWIYGSTYQRLAIYQGIQVYSDIMLNMD